MQFSGADLLVIAIVLIVLFVYRRLDRNNRSLEKVKRFSDKVHDELEAHVQQKVVAIKDMGIELEVHQKSAREVLKRVQAIEQGLNNRASDIERIGTRIAEYDTALDELVRMTGRAEENINRVREESSYVDTVGKRIRQSQERLGQVERGLGSLTDQFRAINQEQINQMLTTTYEHADAHAQELTSELNSFQERVNQFEEFVRGAEARGESVSDRVKAELEEISGTVVSRAQEVTIQSSEQITELRQQLEVMEADYQKRLLSLAERGQEMETDALAKLREQIENSSTQTQKELSARIDGHKRVFLEHVESALTEVGHAEERLAERERALSSQTEQLDGRIGELRRELTSKIEVVVDQAQQQALGSIEERLDEYESQMSYRIEQLGNVGADVEQLEGRLKESMNQVKASVLDEFAAFTADFKRSRESERTTVEGEMQSLRHSMSELETGLVDLKNQAYENVSAKLQVFEDEFFADLKERQVSMEQRVVDWQADLQKEIDSVSISAREERAKLENEYHSELDKRLNEMQTSTYGTYEKVQEDVVQFQRGIELRVSDSKEVIASLEREIEHEIQELSTEARTDLRKQFAEHREQMGNELTELDRTLRQQIDEVGRRFDAERAEMDDSLATSRETASEWKAEVDRLLEQTGGEVNQQIADFRVYIGQSMSDLKEQFASERDDLSEQNTAEQQRLEREFEEMRQQVDKITDDIRAKSAEALTEFGERYAGLRMDSERKVKEFNSDVDSRIKEFRVLVQDSRDQFAANQQRLLGKLNEEATALGTTLRDIDRKQQAFVEHTKIFDRADTLKEELAEDISELKGDIARVEQQRKELHEMESQFARLRKSADEVNEKLQRFVSEKRRIETLEEDYKQLLAMSQAVELKLDHVTASNDALQTVQASLRQLEQLEKDVETRYQRLEKKRSILETTTSGVDKNFEQLQEIETRLTDVRREIDVVPAKVEELSGRLERLAGNRRDADTAIKQLALLDQSLEEIEGRMEQLDQAREWLARTETRLEEVKQEAEEQVKLLGAILKQESRAGKAAEGAPPTTTRDTVIKLARQSWNVDEIARATSLSRGEVELILELSAK